MVIYGDKFWEMFNKLQQDDNFRLFKKYEIIGKNTCSLSFFRCQTIFCRHLDEYKKDSDQVELKIIGVIDKRRKD